MAKYRVKEQSFINGSIVEEGDVIDYDLPEGTTASGNLELVTKSKEQLADDADTKYHAFTRDELKAELDKRNIDYAANAGDANLRGKLEADDAK